MKKLLALFLATAMSLTLAACGNNSSSSTPGGSSGDGSAEYTFIVAHVDPEEGPALLVPPQSGAAFLVTKGENPWGPEGATTD